MASNDIGDLVTAFTAYTEDVQKKIEETVHNRGKEMRAEIISGAPVKRPDRNGKFYGMYRRGERSPGRYKAGFRLSVKVDDNGKVTATVRNSTDPSLVHLLERGHRLKRGGMVQGRSDVGAAQEKYAQIVHEDIKKILEDGK